MSMATRCNTGDGEGSGAPSRTGIWQRLCRCADGISAVEFSLLAPFMVVGAFTTVDLGRAPTH